MRTKASTTAATLAAMAALLAIFAANAFAVGPATTIGGVPAANSNSGTFTFAASGAASYRCSLDNAPYAPCISPLGVGPLAVGGHNFRVYALTAGNDPGPVATYAWTIDLTPPSTPVLIAPADGAASNDTTPTFSGTADPGERVLIFDGPDQIGSVTAAGGAWSFTPLVPLAEGAHSWRARSADAAGNLSAFTGLRTLTIDTTAPATPVINSPSSGALVNKRMPVFAGTGEPGATVNVDELSARLCSAVVAQGGAWQCASTVQLPDGAHSVTAVAQDAAGNVSSAATRSFSLDATPPSAPTIDSPVDGFATQDSDVSVAGSGEVGAAVSIYFAGQVVAATSVGVAGTWSHEFSGLAEGDYTLSAKLTDDYGNVSAESSIVHLRIDRTPPAVTIAQHPGDPSSSRSAQFKFSSPEPVAFYTCSLDGAGWSSCANPLSLSNLSDGAHALQVRATDTAGNQGAASEFDWSVDTDPPSLELIDPPSGSTSAASVRVAFAAEPGASMQCSVDGAAFAFCVSPYVSPPLPSGAHTITVRARDGAGNVTERAAAFTVALATPPVCSLLGAPGRAAESVRVVGLSAARRSLTLALNSSSPAIARVEVVAAGVTLARLDTALAAGASYPTLRLARAPVAGEAAQVRVSFVTTAREFGSASLALTARGSSFVRAPGAVSAFAGDCAAPSGPAKRPKLSATAKTGARKIKLRSKSGGPALLAVTVTTKASTRVVTAGVLVAGSGRWSGSLRLAGGSKLARGRYVVSYRSLSAGARSAKGSASLKVR